MSQNDLFQLYFASDGSGPLINRYCNQLARYRARSQYSFVYKKKDSNIKETSEKPEDSTNDKNTDELLKIVARVRNYYTPFDAFISSWNQVLKMRSEDSKAMEFTCFIQKWPIFSDPKVSALLVSFEYRKCSRNSIFLFLDFLRL